MAYTVYMSKRTLLVAVSGGIDSVALLDMLAQRGEFDMTVAHFDHGIRSDSAADARFVEGLAKKYDLPFVSKREELGKHASEELARSRRYGFLRSEAKKRDALIATAHHSDDVIESIAINSIRGTGWRGLAVLDAPGIVRPLLGTTKAEIREYVLKNRLEWVEDSTNAGLKYLRNRVRQALARIPEVNKTQLLAGWKEQLHLKKVIDSEVAMFVRPDGTYSRYFFTQLDQAVASELLRTVVAVQTGAGPTRPQTERALLAIKTAKPHTRHDIGAGVVLRFTMRTFIVETP